jgi:hypothetical protein
MWSTRNLSRPGAHTSVRRAVYTKVVNHQSTSDYPRPPQETVKPPTRGTRIQTHGPARHLSVSTRRWVGKTQRTLEPVGRERNFRDFFCLPSAEENRTQPADLPQPHRTFNPRISRSRLYD